MVVPQPEPIPPALEVQGLNPWTTRKIPDHLFFAVFLLKLFVCNSRKSVHTLENRIDLSTNTG